MGRIEELRRKLGVTPFYPASEAIQLPKIPKNLNDAPSDKTQPTEPTQEFVLKDNLDNSIINFLLSFGFNHIEPLKFEELILKVFKKFGFTGNLTPVTGDDGIDIDLYDDNELKSIVQCKRYAENQNISVKDIREFLGSMIHVNAQLGYFITTTSFSEQAIEFSKDKQIYLIDGVRLKKIVLHAIAIEVGLYPEGKGAKILSLLMKNDI